MDSYGSRLCGNVQFVRSRSIPALSEGFRRAAAALCATAGLMRFDRGYFESCFADALGSAFCGVYSQGDRALCPHRLHQRSDAHDLHHAFEIVGQYMETHLGTDARQPLGQEMR